jgi:acetyl esterase/lipase
VAKTGIFTIHLATYKICRYMMKKTIFSILLLSACIQAGAQEANYVTRENIPYYPEPVRQTDAYISERCVLDIYYPEHLEGYPTVVWFHGGGLTGGNKEIPEALKAKGMAVVAVNYRLYPKVKAPTYIEDAAAAVAWVFENIDGFGGDPGLVFISGHSAGGYLTSMVGLDKRWLLKHEIDANHIAGLIPLSGHTITHFTVREERGIEGTRPAVDDLAPLYHVRDDAPPLLLITGDREMEILGRYEENAYLMRMMKVAGHTDTRLYEMDGYGHGMTEPAFPLLISEVKRIVALKKPAIHLCP